MTAVSQSVSPSKGRREKVARGVKVERKGEECFAGIGMFVAAIDVRQQLYILRSDHSNARLVR